MKHRLLLALLVFSIVDLGLRTADSPVPLPNRQSTVPNPQPNWGFFAHKRINRLAVLTLPPEMGIFFKKNIEWLTDHATDPDLRRYADPYEAPRHFIDLDAWKTPPPRGWADATLLYSDWLAVLDNGDTVRLFVSAIEEARAVRFDTMLPLWEVRSGGFARLNSLNIKQLGSFWRAEMLPRFHDERWKLPADSLQNWLDQSGLGEHCVREAWAVEHLTEHGIVPWHLALMQRRLTNAFRERNAKKILRLAADFGHYIGDAHVPLHTTSNYDGQKTGQTGLHAFWESRLPELFADKQYDYMVGKPEYLEDPQGYFWAAAMESHRLVDSVFWAEKHVRDSFPADRQLAMDERGNQLVLAPSREFSAAFQLALGGMVERRMRAAIHAVSSAWYTAWIDAGQPDLSDLGSARPTMVDKLAADSLRRAAGFGPILGRPEGN